MMKTLIGIISAILLINTNCHECNPDLVKEIQGYKHVVEQITEEILNGASKGLCYDRLAEFVDAYQKRITGSQVLEDSIDHLLKKYQSEGSVMDKTWKEPVPNVPHWIRGEEEVFLIQPVHKRMSVLAFGGSVATPSGEPVVAEAVVVTSSNDLRSLDTSQVSGKIVVYNQGFEGYFRSNIQVYRDNLYSEIAKLGAIAVLVESSGPLSINSPHTGIMMYLEGERKMPVIAITKEDAQMLRRMYLRGERIVLSVKSNANTLEPSMSYNLIADYNGTKHPDKVVVVSGHIDNWDVGQGAMDDAGGMMIGLISVEIMNRLGLRPKRTIRNILWTAEEQGKLGSKHYFDQHKNELDKFVFVMESDAGTFDPQGLIYTGDRYNGECIIKEILSLLSNVSLFKHRWTSGWVSTDITHFTDAGIPGVGLWDTDGEPDGRYFYFHHTEGDMMTVEDPDALDRAVILWAVTAYIVADITEDFPRMSPEMLLVM
ncbi:carboxypeptidase Q-like [Artemia franciscana]